MDLEGMKRRRADIVWLFNMQVLTVLCGQVSSSRTQSGCGHFTNKLFFPHYLFNGSIILAHNCKGWYL